MKIRETLMVNSDLHLREGIFYQKTFQSNEFQSHYIHLREKEGRVYSTDVVRTLPVVEVGHPLYREWKIRSRSSNRLIRYLTAKSGSKKILEIGCGNGWLCHQLSKVQGTEVVGLDVNEKELKQAAHIFSDISNLAFVAGDIFTIKLPLKFDHIVLASSIQYFPDLKKLLSLLLEKICGSGEVHIVDSPLYPSELIANARARSDRYFASQQSLMTDHYFHHSWGALSTFSYTQLYNPATILTRIKNTIKTDSPFPWIKIKRK